MDKHRKKNRKTQKRWEDDLNEIMTGEETKHTGNEMKSSTAACFHLTTEHSNAFTLAQVFIK